MSTREHELRRRNFRKWWGKNHHKRKAHTWLCYHARNTVFTYAFTPEKFGVVQTITKRYFKSEFPRLRERDAWILWKMTHPTHNNRQKLLETHAHYMSIQVEQLRQAKKELKDEKAHQSQPI